MSSSMQASNALVRQGSYAARIALVAAAYLVAARLSLSLAIPPGYATAVWPPSGIALAAILLLGIRTWPGVWLGAALANLAVEASSFSAVVIASGNTLEALLGSALIQRHAGDPGRFRRGEDVIKFVALCALAAAVAASVALVPLALGHSLTWAEGVRNWWTWWQGDVAGMIIVTPLILSWSARDAGAWAPGRRLEVAYFAALLLVVAAALASDDATHFAPFSLAFVALPFMIWGAFRFGQREVSTAIAVACAFAVWSVLERREMFASAPQNELLLMLLGFVSMVVTTGLVLVAVVGERSRTTEELRTRCRSLESEAQAHARHDPSNGLAKAQEMSGRDAGRLSLENKLRLAIDRREFVLHYQPKVHVDTKQVAGLEALIRWNSPELGLVPPKEFIPVLEETGMILEAGRWAIAQAVLDQGLWAAMGLRVPRVAVNVSSIQLRQRNFVDLVRQAIAGGGGSGLIDLEITESRLMEDTQASIDTLKRLRALGVGIAVDDFGTGYSSLAYLAKLPVQTLKIDGSFIRRMLDDDEAMALVQTIISLAHSLKLTSIAEGVESEAQADLLELLRCDQMQGYFISRPQPPEEIAAFLASS